MANNNNFNPSLGIGELNDIMSTPNALAASTPSGINPVAVGLGVIQTAAGLYGLYKMSKQPKPEFAVSKEVEEAYKNAGILAAKRLANANYGFTPDQKAQFYETLATTNNTAYKRAVDLSGGSLSKAIFSGLTANNIQAINNFAVQDANQKRMNVQYADNMARYADSFAQNYQQVDNMNTQNEISDRIRKQQSYGQAVQSGVSNITDAFSLDRVLQLIPKLL